MGQLLAHFPQSGEDEKTGLSVQIVATVSRLVTDDRDQRRVVGFEETG
jgi:hypothetical protein